MNQQKLPPELLSETEIQARITSLAAEIAVAYDRKPLTVLALLKGAFVFTADLVRALSKEGVEVRIEFISASSYGSGTTSSGEVRLFWQGALPLERERVLLVDDILDTGLTLSRVSELVKHQDPELCKIAVLLDKPSRRKTKLDADFTGFTIPDKFVVGYGLDFDDRYRELPFIAELTPEFQTVSTS